ncbi:hypothetical protein J2W91_000334 [Paenibacillus amylolyticus]|uniref:Uncharacterized protein n=1 Tax=Paenibacillus amylolyticus TaxID=1451 RepID=A0AAP5GYX9_PAEAM|nr:hypothetical protein [Paenibacillus amylolyticus]
MGILAKGTARSTVILSSRKLILYSTEQAAEMPLLFHSFMLSLTFICNKKAGCCSLTQLYSYSFHYFLQNALQNLKTMHVLQ